MTGGAQSFKAVIGKAPGGALLVPVPFDPDRVWGAKPRHLVRGHVGRCGVRGAVERRDDGYALKLGAAWARDNPIAPGDTVEVALEAEGPQRDALEPDIATALAKEPKAAAFFDGLAQFYRKAYLTWIAGTKRKPEERARRIAEVVKLLKAEVKERPRP
jgi:Bacteriocin-protection, YdeI or OmpD-Associated/Domain of unknown function (DUF1905)